MSTEKRSRNTIKAAKNRRFKQFKLAFEEFVNSYDRVVFKSEAKKAIGTKAKELRREYLDKFLDDVKRMDDVPRCDKTEIGFEYETEMDKAMKLVINYSRICTTVKEVLMVIGGLAAMVAAGYLIFCFITSYGLAATLAGLTAIIQFFKNNVRAMPCA